MRAIAPTVLIKNILSGVTAVIRFFFDFFHNFAFICTCCFFFFWKTIRDWFRGAWISTHQNLIRISCRLIYLFVIWVKLISGKGWNGWRSLVRLVQFHIQAWYECGFMRNWNVLFKIKTENSIDNFSQISRYHMWLIQSRWIS